MWEKLKELMRRKLVKTVSNSIYEEFRAVQQAKGIAALKYIKEEQTKKVFKELVEGGVSEEMVQVSKKELEQLRKDSWFLQCLDENGVDSWDGYEAAQEQYEKDV